MNSNAYTWFGIDLVGADHQSLMKSASPISPTRLAFGILTFIKLIGCGVVPDRFPRRQPPVPPASRPVPRTTPPGSTRPKMVPQCLQKLPLMVWSDPKPQKVPQQLPLAV